LREAGAKVEVHDDHFTAECEDEEWLEAVGAHGWLVLTKDKYIRRRPSERRALEDAKVAAFVLTAGRVSGTEMAGAFFGSLTADASHRGHACPTPPRDGFARWEYRSRLWRTAGRDQTALTLFEERRREDRVIPPRRSWR
jgi:hypothetical protein